MVKDNQIHPQELVLSSTVPKERMSQNGNDNELRQIGGEPNGFTDVDPEAQTERRTSHCHNKMKIPCIILCMVLSVGVIAVIIVPPSVCLTVGCPPRPSGTASPVIWSSPSGTTSHPQDTVQPTSTSTTIGPGSSQQPESATAPSHTTLNTETSQQPQTQDNITPSVTDPATTPTPGKPCSEQNLFECNSTGECIAEGLKCNGVKDCEPEGEDEDNCPASTCAPDEFACNDGRCLSDSFRCDGKEDCADKEDELNCPTTSTLGPTTPIP